MTVAASLSLSLSLSVSHSLWPLAAGALDFFPTKILHFTLEVQKGFISMSQCPCRCEFAGDRCSIHRTRLRNTVRRALNPTTKRKECSAVFPRADLKNL